MQLFGLANALLAKDRRTSEHGHSSSRGTRLRRCPRTAGLLAGFPRVIRCMLW